jgi:hypothetical protein
MYHEPFFHDDSGSVRFWVAVGSDFVGATVSRQTLHYRFTHNHSGADPLQTYKTNAQFIDDVVRRRVAGGSIEPVMLREHDLRALPPT